MYTTIERIKRSSNTASSPEYNTVDHSSNVRVSSNKPTTASRRDSWDVINKTKHLLSHNSLESLKNLTESQLNTNLNYNRPVFDHETQRNTHINQYTNNDKTKNDRPSFNNNSRETYVQVHSVPENAKSVYG